MKYHQVFHKDGNIDSTVNLNNYVGARVISKNGEVIGKVSEVRVSPEKMVVEGIVVSRGFLKRHVYIGKSYVSRFSEESFILNVDLSILLNGKRVVTSEGKRVGKVYRVLRKGDTNEIDKVLVRSYIFKFSVSPSNIKYLGESIILKSSHNVKKKYFWQRFE